MFQKKEWIKYGAVVLVFIVCGMLYLCQQKKKDTGDFRVQYELQKETQVQETSNAVGEELTAQTEEINQETVNFVYICGAVLIPGVYECKEMTRLYEVVALAGGFSEEADETALNLADVVRDGQKIYVPKYGEQSVAVQKESGSAAQGLININTAEKDELMKLPGIGESKAKDIIAYRTGTGKFQSVEDIKKIPGIKDAAFNKIKDLICV